jgi:hypothetical protein
MLLTLLVAAAMQPSPVVLESLRNSRLATYVCLTMRVNGFGIPGTATLLVDRRTGRYAEHFAIGPASFSQGFDGTRAWQADATGTTADQGNAVDRGALQVWGYLFANPKPVRVTGKTVQYSDIPQPATFALDRVTHRPKRFELSNGWTNEEAVFAQYHTFPNGIVAPRTIAFTDENGTWNARVVGVKILKTTRVGDFEPPTRANDSTVAGGSTSVPFLLNPLITIPVTVNNGPVLHFVLDTGGQNALLASTVKRLGLRTKGHGTAGGSGAGVIPTSFVTVRSVRIGKAEMRDQSFLVLNTPLLNGVDGVLGFELLSRFAARFEYSTHTLMLRSSLAASWAKGVAAPLSFETTNIEIPGRIEGFPGAMVIDSGNIGEAFVNSPFVAQHHLWTYYHAAKPKAGGGGVGGAVESAPVSICDLRVGSIMLHNVYATLTRATSGFEAHPDIAANVGESILRNFDLTFDYAHRIMYFAQGGIGDKRPAPGESPAITARVRAFMIPLLRGQLDRSMITREANKDVTNSDVVRVGSLLAPLGEPTRLIYKGTFDQPNGRYYVYTVTYASQPIEINVEIDKKTNKFSDFNLTRPYRNPRQSPCSRG